MGLSEEARCQQLPFPCICDPQVIKLTEARALCEIWYYQSAGTSEMFLIPQKRFQLLIREIQQNLELHQSMGIQGIEWFRWERDALIA